MESFKTVDFLQETAGGSGKGGDTEHKKEEKVQKAA